MNNNQYDSFAFRLIIDPNLVVKTSADKLIFTKKSKVKKSNFLTKEIRMKK